MHEDTEVLVSIGLPVFNGEKYISEAIESLLNQSHTNLELIISDNASSDGTEGIVSQYASKDKRIQAFRQDSNIGAAANYLFTLAQARGAYFMWASYDDTWDHDWIRILLSELNPADAGVRGELRLFDEKGILRRRVLPDFPEGSCIKYFLMDESEYKVHYIYSLFHAEKLRRADVNALADSYCPDCFFVYSLIQLGALRSSNATFVNYRVHSENLGKTYSKSWKGWRKIAYRIHPLRYYLTYPLYTKSGLDRFLIYLMIPVKHVYAQIFFWFRGLRELIFQRKFY